MSRAAQIAIVGAGLAGLQAAARLAEAGCAVTLVEKSRGPGGRCATRRGPAGPFDHGAASLRASGPAFHAAVQDAAARGELRPAEAWAGATWRGTGGMNGWPQALAQRLAARGVVLEVLATVQTLARQADGRWALGLAEAEAQARLGAHRFDAVGLAIPAEQARALLAGPAPGLAATLAGVASQPCITLMAAWEAAWDAGPRHLGPEGPLALAFRQDGRDADGPPPAGPDASAARLPTRWTVHATAGWAAPRLDLLPGVLAGPLLTALEARLGAAMPPGPPHTAVVHRWRYAQVAVPAPAACGWDASLRLGSAGDAWQGEATPGQVPADGLARAWNSGDALAGCILAALG